MSKKKWILITILFIGIRSCCVYFINTKLVEMIRINIMTIKLYGTYWGHWDWKDLNYLNCIGQSKSQ